MKAKKREHKNESQERQRASVVDRYFECCNVFMAQLSTSLSLWQHWSLHRRFIKTMIYADCTPPASFAISVFEYFYTTH
jgi:hypothetical protein